jgi:intein/homing endonuclease
MAIRDRALNALRRVFGDERDAREKAESPSADAIRHSPSSTYAIWGREDIGGLLSVSQNLMDRYADYEAMNDYPDIRCFTGEMKVFTIEENNVIVPMTIKKLAADNESRDILAFDTKKKIITRVAAEHPRITGRNAPVLRINLSNGDFLRVTPEHKILAVEPTAGYVEAKELRKGAVLAGSRAGFELNCKSILTVNKPGGVRVVDDPTPDGVETVYDVSTSTHNLLVNGVICHNSAFHYFANDATQPNMDNGRVAWVQSPDQAVVDMADTLLKRRLRLEDDLFSIAYTLCQYGNDFEEVLVTENGVVGLNNLAAPTMRRVEKLNGSLIGYVQDVTGRFTANQDELRRMLAGSANIPKHVALFEDWQTCHFRLRSTTRRSPYGVSVAEGARWIWKRLVMLEDAVMIYKLTRSPARYAFYVDVTDVPPNRVESFLKRAKRDLKKKKMVNPNNNFLDMRYNPLCLSGDTKIPLLDGTEKTIEQIAFDHAEGEQHWVYSVDVNDGNKLVPGEVVWAGNTRKSAQLLKITLDNGESIKVTPDHKMIRRSGEFAEAQTLKVGDSLMPFRSRISDKAKGDGLQGYRLVYCPERKEYVYAHRMVSETLLGKVKGDGCVTHHCNFDPLDNEPTNLQVMLWEKHLELHRALGHLNSIQEQLASDPEMSRRQREGASRAISAYNQTDKARAETAKANRDHDKPALMREAITPEIREKQKKAAAASKKAFWADPEKKAQASKKMRYVYPDEFVRAIAELVREYPKAGAPTIAALANEAGLIEILREANPEKAKKLKNIHRDMVRWMCHSRGYVNLKGFRIAVTHLAEWGAPVPNNHKVAKIEWLEEREDTYTLTVNTAHTFAVSAGVFVKNSNDEDFFIAVRDGKALSRVEVLSGPDYQCLTANTKIPLLDGTEPTIKELCERGGEHWVYSCQEDGTVVPGRGHSVHMSSPDAEIWEVELDNGEVVECTWHHPFLTRDGCWVFARDLQPGDSLMPLYRRMTSKKDGDRLDGYEKVYNPIDDTWAYTHQTVYDALHEDKGWVKGTVIHHEDGKLNNHPEKLRRVTRSEHAQIHMENVKRLHTPEIAERRRQSQQTPEYRQKMSDAWKDSPQSRKDAHQRRMKRRMSKKSERDKHANLLANWNRSEDHKRRVRREANVNWRGDTTTINDLVRLVDTTGARTMRQMMTLGKVSQGVIQRVIREADTTWADFASEHIPDWKPKGRAKCKKTPDYLKKEAAIPGNHKVVAVRKTDRREPVYDITVDGTHCFAVGQGVFVHNTVDDVQYFQRKLHGALMVPRAYLGQDAPIQGRAILSNEDVRAARVSLQIQKELKNGIERLIRIDLAARGHKNPWAVELDVMMTVPSNIYELAAMEVKNARADFAARIQPYVSMRWLLENVFRLPDDEIDEIEKQRFREANQADSMGMDPSFAAFTGGRPPDAEEQQPPPAGGGYAEVPSAGAGAGGGYAEVPSANGNGAGYAEVPGSGGGYAEVPSGLGEARPPKGSSPAAFRAYDRRRRLEEQRDRESRRNHQKLVDMIGTLQQNDAGFARRLDETTSFLREFREATLRRSNGRLVSVPSAGRNRLPPPNGR